MMHFFQLYKKYIILMLGMSILSMTGVGLYLNDQDNKQKLYEKQVIEKIALEKKNKEEKEYLDNLFKTYLNGFKKDLIITTSEYKKSRRLLNEVLSPDNFETQEFAKESYDFFNDVIASNMRKKSSDVISVFQKYKNKIKEDLKGYKTDIGQEFLLKWQEMEKEQLNDYINFFAKEEQIIQAYEEIIKFYYVHSNLFKFDEEENALLFDREEDKQKERELLDIISELRKPTAR